MHSKSDNIEVMINDKEDEVRKELFRSTIKQISTQFEAKKNLTNKKDNKCFRYAVTVALNHGEIKKIAKNNIKEYIFYQKMIIEKN